VEAAVAVVALGGGIGRRYTGRLATFSTTSSLAVHAQAQEM